MLKSTGKIALSLLLAVGPGAAVAQSAEQSQPPAIVDIGNQLAAGTEDTGAGSAEARAQPIDGQIVAQDEGTILANDLVGTTVYSSDTEPIGDVKDLIVSLDGTLEGVVVGVGGLLGIGEKRVAVELSKIDMTPKEDGSLYLMMNTTQAELETAPAFVTVAQQRAAQQVEEAQTESLQNMQQNNAVPTVPGTTAE